MGDHRRRISYQYFIGYYGKYSIVPCTEGNPRFSVKVFYLCRSVEQGGGEREREMEGEREREDRVRGREREGGRGTGKGREGGERREGILRMKERGSVCVCICRCVCVWRSLQCLHSGDFFCRQCKRDVGPYIRWVKDYKPCGSKPIFVLFSLSDISASV